MACRDVREFLAALRERRDLVDIERPIDLGNDAGKTLKQTNCRQGPAPNFTRNGTDGLLPPEAQPRERCVASSRRRI